jgi:hypothetical protein
MSEAAVYELTMTKPIYLPDAFSVYMTTNFPSFTGYSLNGTVMTINTRDTLTDAQLATLNTLLNDYVDPPSYMNFSNSVSFPLHSNFTSESDLTEIDGFLVLQTFIYQNPVQSLDPSIVLDGLKTVIEYNTPNVQNYVNSTSGSVTVQLYDITRNVQIASSQVDIGTESIATEWNALAQTGSTAGNTVYKSHQFSGLMNRSTGYDCVWQLRATTSEPHFNVRFNGLQYLYYQHEVNPNV